MLQVVGNSIQETTTGGMNFDIPNGEYTMTSTVACWAPYTIWNSYPVYVCSDRTAKAIEILKALQSEKVIKVESVPRFIELVEKIASKL